MKLDVGHETDRMAGSFEAEALGEAKWLQSVFGETEIVSMALAAVALERAAMRLRLRGRKA